MPKKKTEEEKQQEQDEMKKFLEEFPGWAAKQYEEANER